MPKAHDNNEGGVVMRARKGVSRRQVLELAGAGGLALAGGIRASAQGAKRIERLDPGLDAIVATSEPVKDLADGFGGPLGPAEGPLWWKEGGYLLFTDIHNNRRMKYTPGGRATVDLEPSNRANGLTRDLQGRLLYINDTRRGHVRSFELLPNGTLAKQSDREFVDLRGGEPGAPDGMKVDVAGNVYCGGAGGIWIIAPDGKKLGRIVHGQPATTNIAFGGDDWKTLLFTSRSHLASVQLKIAGLPVPVPAKK